MQMEVYRPPGREKHPAVILLHGVDGPRGHTGRYQESAVELAQQGFEVLMVHYFEATGTQWADRMSIGKNFLKWLDAISDALAFARSRPGVDRNRVALVGVSLGASLALNEASRDSGVRAVAEVSGAVPPAASAFMEHMPPVLILHGADDNVVPVENAMRLEQALKARGIRYESHIYPNQGHVFTAPTARDAMSRIVAFLKRAMAGADTAAAE